MVSNLAKVWRSPCGIETYREKVMCERIIQIARKRKIDFQLEVEGSGSSDGRELQTSPYPFDWCFVGAPEQNPHTPTRKSINTTSKTMIDLYGWLMKDL
jgi:putative aminopeptidase FrvX